MIGQSPPTTSGIVIISGSNDFIAGSSDFPCPVVTIVDDYLPTIFDDLQVTVVPNKTITFGHLEIENYVQSDVMQDMDSLDFTNSPALTFGHLELTEIVPTVIFDIDAQFAPTSENLKITTTEVTTSGIVILDFFPGAGEALIPYVPPVFLNQRIYPVTFSGLGERLFPEENRRIYPVLPQFSVITPGD